MPYFPFHEVADAFLITALFWFQLSIIVYRGRSILSRRIWVIVLATVHILFVILWALQHGLVLRLGYLSISIWCDIWRVVSLWEVSVLETIALMPVIDLPLFRVRCFASAVASLSLEVLVLIVCLSTFQHPLLLALSSLMPLTTHIVAVSVAWTFYCTESGVPDEEAGTISSHQREHRSTLFAVAWVGSAVVIFSMLLLTLSAAGVLHPSLFTQGLLCLTISLQARQKRSTGDHVAIVPHESPVTRSSAIDPPVRSSTSQPDTIARIFSFQPLEPIPDTIIASSIPGNRETRRYA